MSSDAPGALNAPRLVFPPGTVVEGKYRVERALGQGEMGCVYLATHLRNGESVALKFMHPADPSQGPAAFSAFLHAARAAARFRSENVVHVRDMGMLDDGSPFLVMDYVEGGTLEALIRARAALPVAQSVDLAMQAARGLGDAHAAGVIHRDVKPTNWFLARVPNGATSVKLLDFGGARIIPRPGSAEDRRAPSSGVVGTFPYTAPEQIHAPSEVDERADVWTVGVVLYEMLVGSPPFRDETLVHMRERILTDPPATIRRVRSDVPAELEAAVFRCLEKRPDMRFAEMADLTLALAPFRVAERRSSNPPKTGVRTSPLPPPPLPPRVIEVLEPALSGPGAGATATRTGSVAPSAPLPSAASASVGGSAPPSSPPAAPRSTSPSILPPPLRGSAPPPLPTPAGPETTSPESSQMATVAPVRTPPAVVTNPRSSTDTVSRLDRIRRGALALSAKPRVPLLIGGAAALVVGAALVSAAATSGSEKTATTTEKTLTPENAPTSLDKAAKEAPAVAPAEETTPAATTSEREPGAGPVGTASTEPPAHAHGGASERHAELDRATAASPTASPLRATATPSHGASDPGHPATEAPAPADPAATKAARAPTAAAKTAGGVTAPPVGTSGFGERE
jgi:serine/threonine-protein kinase